MGRLDPTNSAGYALASLVLNGSPNPLALPGESDNAYGDRLNLMFDDFFDRVSGLAQLPTGNLTKDPLSAI